MRSPRLRAILSLLLLAIALTACASPARHVEFIDGRCVVDGTPASLSQVEALQARISERILDRQPLFAVITLAIVVLAGLSHIEKLILLFSTRKQEAKGLGERIKNALERQRSRPLRYFAILIGTLALLAVAGGLYVYLDADKRASERALGQLQFCHLALRSSEEQGVIDEQRKNLEALSATAGSIRSLVDALPPDDQRRAKQIVDQINGALGRQSRLFTDYIAQNDATSKAAAEHRQLLLRGISSVESGITGLKAVPQAVQDLTTHVKNLEDKVSQSPKDVDAKLEARLATRDARFTALEQQLKTLAARLDKCEPPRPTTTQATRPTTPDLGAKTP